MAHLGVEVAELSAQGPNVAEVAGLQRARTSLLHVIAPCWWLSNEWQTEWGQATLANVSSRVKRRRI